MKRSLTTLSLALCLIASTSACSPSFVWPGRASDVPAPAGTASITGTLGLPTVGNPRYDRFFGDVAALARSVADARAALDTAATTLNRAMNVAEATDFETAVKNAGARLKGKIAVHVDLTPSGASVSVTTAAGVTLTAEEQSLMEAYQKVATYIAAVPVKLAPVVPRSIDTVRQALALMTSARSDFAGIKGLMTLPSVIDGLQKVVSAMNSIKTDVPILVDRSRAMVAVLKDAV